MAGTPVPQGCWHGTLWAQLHLGMDTTKVGVGLGCSLPFP